MNNLLILISIIGIPFFILFLYERNIKNKLLKDGVEVIANVTNIFEMSALSQMSSSGLLDFLIKFKNDTVVIDYNFDVNGKKYRGTFRIVKKYLTSKNLDINSFKDSIKVIYCKTNPNICKPYFLLNN